LFKGVPLTLSVTFGSQDAPGLVTKYMDGKQQLDSVNLIVDGSFNLENVQLRAQGLTVAWHHLTDGTEQFTFGGGVSVTVWKFTATVTLGSADSPGLVINDGVWSLKDIDIKLQNLPLGGSGFTISVIEVHYQQVGTSFNLFVDAGLTFPSGGTVTGA